MAATRPLRCPLNWAKIWEVAILPLWEQMQEFVLGVPGRKGNE